MGSKLDGDSCDEIEGEDCRRPSNKGGENEDKQLSTRQVVNGAEW
jgi:hypothetical protein